MTNAERPASAAKVGDAQSRTAQQVSNLSGSVLTSACLRRTGVLKRVGVNALHQLKEFKIDERRMV